MPPPGSVRGAPAPVGRSARCGFGRPPNDQRPLAVGGKRQRLAVPEQLRVRAVGLPEIGCVTLRRHIRCIRRRGARVHPATDRPPSNHRARRDCAPSKRPAPEPGCPGGCSRTRQCPGIVRRATRRPFRPRTWPEDGRKGRERQPSVQHKRCQSLCRRSQSSSPKARDRLAVIKSLIDWRWRQENLSRSD